MPGMTDYSATNWLNYIVGKSGIPSLPTVFIGLFTTAPTSDSGIIGAVEVSGGNYTRSATTPATWASALNSSGNEPAVTPASISNAAAILFSPSSANWGTVTSFGLFDAVASGNLLTWDYLGNFSWLPAVCSIASPGVITAPAHGFSNNDNVVITTKYGGSLPSFSQANFTGLLVVANVTTDTFTVTNNGQAVNTSSTGDFQVRKVASQTINQNSQTAFNPSTLVINAA